MKRRNICKFTPPGFSENLSVPCFVLETDETVMQRKVKLNYFRLILVIKGNGNMTLDDEEIQLSEGTLILGLKGEIFSVCCDNSCNYMYIDFDGLRAEQLLKRFNINKNNRCFTGFDGLIPLWEESLARASDQTIDLVSESIIIYTFSRLNDNSSALDNTVNKVMEITEEQFNDSDLSISAIAEELGYNPKYLSHLFKQKTNKNYSEYLRCIRIKYAVSLFDNGLDSVKNVALLSGFKDPLYFSTVFKNTIGLSPKEYLAIKSDKK